jgi:hypothetical protein
MLRIGFDHIFRLRFGLAIDRERILDVLDLVGPFFFAIKDIVGRDIKELRPHRFRGFNEVVRALNINEIAGERIRLSFIDRSISSEMDHGIRFQFFDDLHHSVFIRDIAFGPIDS